jgi:hypothetical protein
MKKMTLLAAALLVTSALGTQASLAQSHSKHGRTVKIMLDKDACYKVTTDDSGRVTSIVPVAC